MHTYLLFYKFHIPIACKEEGELKRAFVSTMNNGSSGAISRYGGISNFSLNLINHIGRGGQGRPEVCSMMSGSNVLSIGRCVGAYLPLTKGLVQFSENFRI